MDMELYIIMAIEKRKIIMLNYLSYYKYIIRMEFQKIIIIIMIFLIIKNTNLISFLTIRKPLILILF